MVGLWRGGAPGPPSDHLLRELELEVKTRLTLVDEKLELMSEQMRRCVAGIEDLHWAMDGDATERPIPSLSQPLPRHHLGNRARLTAPAAGDETPVHPESGSDTSANFRGEAEAHAHRDDRGPNKETHRRLFAHRRLRSRSQSFNRAASNSNVSYRRSHSGFSHKLSEPAAPRADFRAAPSRSFVGDSFADLESVVAPEGGPKEEGGRKGPGVAEGTGSPRSGDSGAATKGGAVPVLRGGAHESVQLPKPSGGNMDGGEDMPKTSVDTLHSGISSPPQRLSSWIIARQRRQGAVAEAVWNFLEEPESSAAAMWFSRLVPSFILATVLVTLLQTFREDSPIPGATFAGGTSLYIETAIECVFLLEIVVRLAACPNRYMFFASPFNVIDIVSALPLALRLLIAFDADAKRHVLHMIFWGFVPVLRLLKVLRRFQEVQLLAKAFRLAFEALPVLLFIYVLQLLIFTACLYCFEESDMVQTLPEAMWLMFVSMTTVGYGDAFPTSSGGKFVSAMGIICASLYIAIPLGIIGSCFSEVWMDRDRILLVHRLRSRLLQWGYRARDIPKLFSHFDIDRNGLLDLAEFRRMVQLLKLGLRQERIVGLFEAFDGDGSGAIDDKEFVKSLFPAHYHELYDGEGEVRRWMSPQQSLPAVNLNMSTNLHRFAGMLRDRRLSIRSMLSGASQESHHRSNEDDRP